MYNPVHQKHIHRPALERYAQTHFKTLRNVKLTEIDTMNKYRVEYEGIVVPLDQNNNPDVFQHKVTIDRFGIPWFDKAGCGKTSREYADVQSETCLISAEVERKHGSSRRFASFVDNQSFVEYNKSSRLPHAYESIRPDTCCMLFTDHDQAGGLNDVRKHQEGVLQLQRVLFDLLGLPEQTPVVLTSHRTKESGDYLSTHLRFTTVSLESCNGTLKAIHHLLKHTNIDFGGLDFGTHRSYQLLRLPGCSKAGSRAKLLPADGSALGDIGELMVGNSAKREVHITTEMVSSALKQHFGCSNDCGLKTIRQILPLPEANHVTMQIHAMYYHYTGKDPNNLTYQHGKLWSVGHSERCIHSERHKSNGMYIIVRNRAVYCQCHGRCKQEGRPEVLLGYLHTKLSSDKYAWQQTPRSCYAGITAIDVMSRIPRDVSPVELAKHLACIGDLKALLDAYAGRDTHDEWTAATAELASLKEIPLPGAALVTLKKYIDYHVNPNGNNKKRKRAEGEADPIPRPLDYKFDFERFQREHPHLLAIDDHTISHQIINTRFIKYDELDLSHRINLVKSEMMTGKTSNLIIKELQALPPNARVLMLTPRRLFSESLRGVLKENGFHFAHYKDLNHIDQRSFCLLRATSQLFSNIVK